MRLLSSKQGAIFFEEIEKVLQISDLFCEICRWEVVFTGRSISSRKKLNSLVERGNREHFDKLSASQGTGNRKINCVINSVPLLTRIKQ
jgi:hypothetical protein